MRSLFARARFREASVLYEKAVADGQRPSPELTFLNVRALLTADARKALEFLLQGGWMESDPATRFRWNLYSGIAHARLGDFDRADERLADAIPSDNSPAERALRAYHLSRRFLQEQRPQEAWKHWEGSRVDTSTYGKIRSEHLRSFILSQEERYVEQAESLLAVIKLISRDREAYLGEWYWAVHTLAGLAREIPLPAATSVVERELSAGVEWSPDFTVNYFQALKAMGWCQALAGDQMGCFRYLRRAQHLEVALPWKVIVTLDRSYFAHSVGEKQWALNELLAAEELARGIRWETYAGEERVGLLLFAELFSSIEPQKAARYLERYDGLADLHAPLIHGSFDRRLRALRNYTAGVVFAAQGKGDDGVTALRSAWSVFDAIGYEWRAGRAAIRLSEISGKSRWRHLAEDKLEAYPRSWLALELQEFPTPDVRRPHLPRMQQKIFDLLCAGMTTAEIAKALGRSPNTVQNHIRMIFKAFGVRSRHALVAMAAKRNLIA